MANTDKIRKSIEAVIKGNDLGLVIAALAQTARMCFAEIDARAPHLSEQSRKDFEKHLNPPEQTEH